MSEAAGAASGAIAGGSTGGNAGGAGSGQGAGNAGGAPQTSTVSGGASSTGVNPGLSQDWTSNLNDSHKAYVQQKGFKDPVSVLDSYINMEKLLGVPQDRLLKLPTKSDDPAWGDVYNKLGRPMDPKEYKIEVPQGMDAKFADWARSTFHELGITKDAGEKLAAKWNGFQSEAQKAQTEAYTQKVTQENENLKKDWGMAYDQNINIAKSAASAFGLDGQTIDKLEAAMGFAGTMKFLSSIGEKIGEGKFISGGAGQSFGGALTPEQARGRIQNLRQDPDFVNRYVKGDMAAREEMERLHRMAVVS